MKKVEIIVTVIAMLSVIMSLFLIPGGAVLMILSFSLLSLFYLPYGYFGVHNLKTRELKDQNTFSKQSALKSASGIVTGIVVSMLIIGCLFKLMTWTGADIMLNTGLTFLPVPLIMGGAGLLKEKNESYFFVFSRLVFFGVAAIVLYSLPKYAIIEYKYRHYPSYIEAFKRSQEDPRNEELRKKMHEEYFKMSNVR